METYNKLSASGFETADHGIREEFVCSEKRSRYSLSLNPRMEGWRYQVDGYIITEGDKCDALILVKDGDDFAEVFVELKGSDVKHAITQLEETLKHNLFKDNDYLLRWGRIAVYSYPKSLLLDQLVDKKTGEFLNQYHCDLRITRADKLTHDMFEAIRKKRTQEPQTINISALLNSGDDSKVNQAVAILYLRLEASPNPQEVVKEESILQLLVLLNNSDSDFVPIALRYIELCITKCNDVFFNENMIMYMNDLLEKYRGKYDGTKFVLAEEIEDRTNDVKQSLSEIYRFLHDAGFFYGDEKFWEDIEL
jgi:hypothetical protein